MLPPYTGYAHGHNSGELSISVRTPPHTHLHARAHTPTHAHARAHTHPHIHMHARTHTCPVLSSHCHKGCVGLEGTRERIGERSPIDTHTRAHTHTHTHTHTCTQHVQVHTWQLTTRESHKFTCGHELYSQLVIPPPHTPPSYCLGHMREEQESEYVTQTQCASTC